MDVLNLMNSRIIKTSGGDGIYGVLMKSVKPQHLFLNNFTHLLV